MDSRTNGLFDSLVATIKEQRADLLQHLQSSASPIDQVPPADVVKKLSAGMVNLLLINFNLFIFFGRHTRIWYANVGYACATSTVIQSSELVYFWKIWWSKNNLEKWWEAILFQMGECLSTSKLCSGHNAKLSLARCRGLWIIFLYWLQHFYSKKIWFGREQGMRNQATKLFSVSILIFIISTIHQWH